MTETTGNHFIAQSRRDLAGGMSASIVLAYAKHHLGALQALHLMTDERAKAIRETAEFIRELEIIDGK